MFFVKARRKLGRHYAFGHAGMTDMCHFVSKLDDPVEQLTAPVSTEVSELQEGCCIFSSATASARDVSFLKHQRLQPS